MAVSSAWQSAVHLFCEALDPGRQPVRKNREKKREKMCQQMTSKLREQSVWQSVQLYDECTTILHHLLTFTSTSTKATPPDEWAEVARMPRCL